MKDLAVNQKVEICRDNEEEIYKSLIQEVGEGYFAIQIPSGPQGWLTLHVGERVNVNVFSPSAQYCFTTEVIGRKKEKNIPMYLLKIPEEFTRIQRRDYVRIKLTLEVFFEPVNTEELDNLDMKAELSRRGVTLDISGGGMQLVTDEP
ncbi:flagellar brake protein, partial [Calderihabitans maritimus]